MNKEQTNSVLESNNSVAIKRHQQTLKTISANVSHMRLQVEVKKLASKEKTTGIQTWNANVDTRLQEADFDIGKVGKWLYEHKKEAEITAKGSNLNLKSFKR